MDMPYSDGFINRKFFNVLFEKFRDKKLNIKDLFLVHHKIGGYAWEINLIYERVLKDIKREEAYMRRAKKFYDDIENEKIKLSHTEFERENKALSDEDFESVLNLRVDIKSLYSFIKSYLDIVAYLIHKYKSDKYPRRMRKLLAPDKRIIDEEFYDELIRIIPWFSTFKNDRDAMIHDLGNLKIIFNGDSVCFAIERENVGRGIREIESYFERIAASINELNIFICKSIFQ